MACHAYAPSALAAILHFRATTADVVRAYNARAKPSGGENDRARKVDSGEKDQMGLCSFICKLITNAINSQNILRFAGFDFDLAADILDMRVDGAFI